MLPEQKRPIHTDKRVTRQLTLFTSGISTLALACSGLAFTGGSKPVVSRSCFHQAETLAGHFHAQVRKYVAADHRSRSHLGA